MESFGPIFSQMYITCCCVDLHKNMFEIVKIPKPECFSLHNITFTLLATWILNRPKAQEVWASVFNNR